MKFEKIAGKTWILEKFAGAQEILSLKDSSQVEYWTGPE